MGSADTLGYRRLHLDPFFAHLKAARVTGATVQKYIKARLDAGAARATINREIAVIVRAFSLAMEQDILSSAPKIKRLTEDNVREGFVDAGDFEAVVAELGDEVLQDLARLGHVMGWRSGELKSLSWPDINRETRTITLRREHSKNKQARVIRYTPAMGEIIDRRFAARVLGCPFVFHRSGKQILTFRNAWENAAKRAGRPHLLFHDLRRSAVRNLTSSGVDQAVAMKITGHRTDSVFQRYRIVDERDTELALEKVEAHNAATPKSNVVSLRREA